MHRGVILTPIGELSLLLQVQGSYPYSYRGVIQPKYPPQPKQHVLIMSYGPLLGSGLVLPGIGWGGGQIKRFACKSLDSLPKGVSLLYLLY